MRKRLPSRLEQDATDRDLFDEDTLRQLQSIAEQNQAAGNVPHCTQHSHTVIHPYCHVSDTHTYILLCHQTHIHPYTHTAVSSDTHTHIFLCHQTHIHKQMIQIQMIRCLKDGYLYSDIHLSCICIML